MKNIISLLISIFLFGLSACEQAEPKEEIIPNVSLTNSKVSSQSGYQFADIQASGEWTLALNFKEEAQDWARVNMVSGKDSYSAVVLSWDENPSEESRECELVLTSKNGTSTAVLTQSGKSASAIPDTKPDYTGIKTSTPAAWLELPATDREDMYFITHDMTMSGKKIRNFSYYYDAEAMLALWVAYPLNKGLLSGSSGRTNNWGFDPKVPAQYQQTLNKGYTGGSYGRGHQIPSADRQTYESNSQTFYFTNMTPQKGELNAEQWASLEGRVRTWANQSDTLYVVTGADFRNSSNYASDNVGKRIPVPTGYFKALLSYKKSSSKYSGIAFYYEHRRYTNNIMDQSMTIDKLEEKLGIDFFVNLPNVAGQTAADKAESTIDSWWKN